MALMSASDLYSRIPGLASGADSALNALLGRAESHLARYCGWVLDGDDAGGSSVSWDSASRVFYLDGPEADGRTLQLPVKPVTAVASVYDDSEWGWGSDDLIAASNYTLLQASGQIILNPDATEAWSTGKRNIKVTCTAGFTSAPRTLQEAILTYAAEVYAKMPAAGKASVRSNDTTVTFDMVPVSKRVRALLRDFRCPTVWLS